MEPANKKDKPMDLELPEELRMLKKTVADFVDRELIPIEHTSMDGPVMSQDIREKLQAKAKELGLWLLDTPVEYGGQGLGLLAMVVVWEELARTIAMPPRGPLVFGPDVRPILFTLPEEQKQKYLLPVLRGEKVTAFAQSEPDAGADPGSMRTTAVRQGDHYIINGYKRWITNAGRANFFQLVAATDRAKGSRGGLSMFLVDADTPGVKVIRPVPTMMGDAPYEIAFDNVKIPVENLIGREGWHEGRAILDHQRAALSGLPGPGRRQALPRHGGQLLQAARDLRFAPVGPAGDPVQDRRQLHGAPHDPADGLSAGGAHGGGHGAAP